MALHFDIHVNRLKIGYVFIRRLGAIRTDGQPNRYEVTVYLDVEGRARHTVCEHHYFDGPLELIAAAMLAAEKVYSRPKARP